MTPLALVDTPAAPHAALGEDPSGDALQRHGIRIGPLGLLLPLDRVCEVGEDLPWCALPHAPAWLFGMANLRGNTVPVFDLGELLDETQAGAGGTLRVVVLGQRDEAVGIRVADLPVRVTINGASRTAAPALPDGLRPYAGHACLDVDGYTWLDWDVDGFFAGLTAVTGE